MRIPTGELIREVRKDRGLTQAEVAERAGVSQPMIARIESEDVDPTLETLHSVVSALNGTQSSVDQEEVAVVVPSALKDARTYAGYTQGELADQAGVSQALISRIECEDVNPCASTLRSIFTQVDPVSHLQEDKTNVDIPTVESEIIASIESDFEEIYNSST
jgi:predicted transcriptional regulator